MVVRRADGLGRDEYHNRPMPRNQEGEFAIIAPMVALSQTIRSVSLLYNAKPPGHPEDLAYVDQLDGDLDAWLRELPEQIRPGAGVSRPLSALREPEWCRRQRLVLEIRKFNHSIPNGGIGH
ncbi:uncharacterized protein LTR77_006000 [Saxophila tyrrhenica]|uniref:Uncharacterized protein n=1 Tax=Saxophila tyrrhenica TaxID=1690608 RepID=A0AAV9P6M6_9PEZI|nr:hypothetical protein LTR77_006000 [Saxophila tyrrhenica]